MQDKEDLIDELLEDLKDYANQKTIQLIEAYPSAEEFFQVSVTIPSVKGINDDKVQRLKEIAEHQAGVTKIETTSRKRIYSNPRNIFIYLIRKNFGYSLKQIGRKVGGRDHSTILHSLDTFENDYKTNDKFKQLADSIIAEAKLNRIISRKFEI